MKTLALSLNCCMCFKTSHRRFALLKPRYVINFDNILRKCFSLDEAKELLKRTNGDAPIVQLMQIRSYNGMRIKGLKSTINVDYMKPLDLLLP